MPNNNTSKNDHKKMGGIKWKHIKIITQKQAANYLHNAVVDGLFALQ